MPEELPTGGEDNPTPTTTTAPAPTGKAPVFDGEFDATRAAKLVENLRLENAELKKRAAAATPVAKEPKPGDTPTDPRYTELENRLAAAEKRDAERAAKELRGRIAEESGVPADLLIGNDETSLKAYADQLTKWAADQAVNPLRGRPRARLVPGTGGQDPDGGFDPAAIAKAAHR